MWKLLIRQTSLWDKKGKVSQGSISTASRDKTHVFHADFNIDPWLVCSYSGHTWSLEHPNLTTTHPDLISIIYIYISLRCYSSEPFKNWMKNTDFSLSRNSFDSDPKMRRSHTATSRPEWVTNHLSARFASKYIIWREDLHLGTSKFSKRGASALAGQANLKHCSNLMVTWS